jgi:hypothetical protein
MNSLQLLIVKNELLNQHPAFGGYNALYATKSGDNSSKKSFEDIFRRPSSGNEDDVYVLFSPSLSFL